MGPRLLLLLACTLASQPFSRSYVDALRNILDLDEPAANRLQRQLARNPEDTAARLQLIAYYHRTNDPKRQPLVLWLIAHHPESEILHSPFTRFQPNDLTATQLDTANRLWQSAKPQSAAVTWNAASFFETLDPKLYLHYLERTAATDPNHPAALRPLAHLYARELIRGDHHAQAALDASQNVWILGNAANLLHLLGNTAQAERYFLRAQVLNPNLDRRAILPPNEPAKPEAPLDFDTAAKNIRRLPVSSFPSLPPAIAKFLTQRNCQITQPAGPTKPVNVIQGDFFTPGEPGWAVLCSVNQRSAILVFRNSTDAHPAVLGESEDRNHLQGLGGREIGYSREITPVGKQFIERHYRAYGGPKPPPITHSAIDDAFLGKASVTLYHHNGKWITLQGAD